MWCTLALGILQVVLMTTLWPFGIRFMVIAFVALNIIWVGVWFYFVARQTGYQVLSFLKDTMPFALTAFGVMVTAHFSTTFISSLWLLLICRFVLAASLYYIIMRLARVKILADCQQFVLSKLRKETVI